MEISRKLVLITGGSSGIGKQLAIDFLKAKARVIIVSENSERLQQALAELRTLSTQVYSVECDVGYTESVLKLRETVLEKYGSPDILVNNAGFATYRTFEATPFEELERLIQVNLLGAMRCTRAFLPEMIERKSGAIVNMASIAGRMAMTPNGVYSASKRGMVGWSETLKWELAPFGIQVNVMCPGRVETAFFDHETFQSRIQRAETRYTITVKDISDATIKAIQRNRFLTCTPWTLGAVAWLLEVFPIILKPVYSRLMISRIKTLYKTQKKA